MSTEVPDVGALIRQISGVQDQLSRLSDDDARGRAALLEEEGRLRDLLRGFRKAWDEGRSREDVEAELKAYQARYREAKAQRIDLVKQMGGGGNAGPGADGWGALQLNIKIDAATGIKDLEARISRLEEILDSMDAE